jgi:hypothetical protein
MRLGYQLFAPGVLFCELLVPTKVERRALLPNVNKDFDALVRSSFRLSIITIVHTLVPSRKKIVCLYIAHS